MNRITKLLLSLIALACPFAVAAADDPIELRQQMMEEVGEGAKAIGGMLKGEQEFDAALVMESLEVWRRSAAEFGKLFPVGSETGSDTEARMTIWTDREGFEAILVDFAGDVDAAIVASPQDLDALQVVAEPAFKNCKKCHEEYRVEEE